MALQRLTQAVSMAFLHAARVEGQACLPRSLQPAACSLQPAACSLQPAGDRVTLDRSRQSMRGLQGVLGVVEALQDCAVQLRKEWAQYCTARDDGALRQ